MKNWIYKLGSNFAFCLVLLCGSFSAKAALSPAAEQKLVELMEIMASDNPLPGVLAMLPADEQAIVLKELHAHPDQEEAIGDLIKRVRNFFQVLFVNIHPKVLAAKREFKEKTQHELDLAVFISDNNSDTGRVLAKLFRLLALDFFEKKEDMPVHKLDIPVVANADNSYSVYRKSGEEEKVDVESEVDTGFRFHSPGIPVPTFDLFNESVPVIFTASIAREEGDASDMCYNFGDFEGVSGVLGKSVVGGVEVRIKEETESFKQQGDLDEDVDEKEGLSYFITVSNDDNKYKTKSEIAFLVQNNKVILTLGNENKELVEENIIWKVSNKEECVNNLSCELGLKSVENRTIKVYHDKELLIKINLSTYDKPKAIFAPNVDFSGQFGFDQANIRELQLANDYENFSLKQEKYYVPVITMVPNQREIIKLKLRDLSKSAKNDKDFKIKLKPTNNQITIDFQPELELTYNELLQDVPILIGTPNVSTKASFNKKEYIVVTDHLGDVIGKIALVYGAVIKEISVVFIYVDSGNGYPSKSVNDILNFINLKSHNQFFRKWTLEKEVKLDISSHYKGNSSVYQSHETVLSTLRSQYKKDNDYQLNQHYYFITDLTVSKQGGIVGGQAVMGGNIGAVYDKGDNEAIAHEFGHLLNLDHTFSDDLGQRKLPQGSTKNYMDYISNGRNMFFLYQMKGIK
jgi:hypothetical protein